MILYKPNKIFNTRPTWYFHLVRTILTLIKVYPKNTGNETSELILVSIVIITYYHTQGKELDYFNPTRWKYHSVFAALYLWVGILKICIWAFGDYYNCILLSGSVFGSLGICSLVILIKKNTLTVLSMNEKNMDNEILRCISFIILRDQCLKNKSSYHCKLLSGFLLNHYSQCKYPFCPITTLMISKKNNIIKYYEKIFNVLLNTGNQFMNEILIKYPNSVFAKLLYISIIINTMK